MLSFPVIFNLNKHKQTTEMSSTSSTRSPEHVADGRPRCKAQRAAGSRCPFPARRRDGPNGFYHTCGVHKKLEYVFCSTTGLPSGSARRVIVPRTSTPSSHSFLQIKYLPSIDEKDNKEMGNQLWEFIKSVDTTGLMEGLCYSDTTAYCICPGPSEAQALREKLPEELLGQFVAYEIVDALPPPRSPPGPGERKVDYCRGVLPPRPQGPQGASIQSGGTQVNIMIF